MVKRQKSSRSWTIRGCLLLLFTTSVIPANHSGASLNLIESHSEALQSTTRNGLIDTALTSTPSSDKSEIRLLISRPTLWWTAVVPVASFVLINIILGYLCDQPTNKQCLINLLYRDVLSINITHICLWSFSVFYCEYQEQMPFSETEAQAIAYTNQILTLLVLGYLNTIGIIRLWTVTHKQLDLLVPFLGEEDEIALRNIRCGIYSMMGTIFGAEFFLSAIPPVYYPLTNGIKVHVKNLSNGSIVVIASQLFLLSAGAILHICAKIFIAKENAKIRPITLKQGKINHPNVIGIPDTQNEPALTQFVAKYGFIAPLLPNAAMMIGLAVVIGLQIFLPPKQALGENNTSFWNLVSVIIGFEGVFFPSWLIMINKSLRSYTKRQVMKVTSKLTTILRKCPTVLKFRRNNVITPK